VVILMPVHDQSGSEFGPKVRGLGRKQDSIAGIALQRVDVRNRARTRAHAEAGSPDLDGCEVPTGGVAMVPVGKIERLRGERPLQSLNVVRVGDAPEFVQASESVLRRNVGIAGRLQQRREGTLGIAAPQPQAARVDLVTVNGGGAAGDPVGDCLLVSEHLRIRAIEYAHDADSRRLTRVARRLKALSVDEEGRFAVEYQRDVAEVSRSLDAGHVEEFGKVPGGDARGEKGQKDRHTGESRIAGSLP